MRIDISDKAAGSTPSGVGYTITVKLRDEGHQGPIEFLKKLETELECLGYRLEMLKIKGIGPNRITLEGPAFRSDELRPGGAYTVSD